ncbi:MAG: hypothetical protein JW712_06400 [Dehalococcoidales bacterium]|nr:hypothetical protein [Dehalococcoidales bacterium]
MHDPGYGPEYYLKSRDILDTALDYIPAYRSWRVLDPGKDRPIDERYTAMPYLHKSRIRDYFPDGFTPAGVDVNRALERGELGTASTSGSSDISVMNIWNQEWWDATERASWQRNSDASRLLTGTQPEAILANPLNVGVVSDNSELSMEERRLERFLYLNEMTDPSQWSSAHMDRMLKELALFKPVSLEANPSFLARLSKYAADNNREVYQPGIIIFTYEYPSILHYRQIRRVFKCPLVSSYGSTETGHVFMQCEAGKFHQNTEFVRVDFQPFKPEFGGPVLGRILVTTFGNRWYYMVRFDIRDLVRVDAEQSCPCGRNDGLILSAVEGRSMSVTLTCDGRPVTLRALDNVISSLDGVLEYQLEQLEFCRFILHLVNNGVEEKRLTDNAVGALKSLYGEESDITVDFRKALSPEDSGKYALAKRHFSVDIDGFIA